MSTQTLRDFFFRVITRNQRPSQQQNHHSTPRGNTFANHPGNGRANREVTTRVVFLHEVYHGNRRFLRHFFNTIAGKRFTGSQQHQPKQRVPIPIYSLRNRRTRVSIHHHPSNYSFLFRPDWIIIISRLSRSILHPKVSRFGQF